MIVRIKEHYILENRKYYGINDISVCVDNDDGGKKFYKLYKRRIQRQQS